MNANDILPIVVPKNIVDAVFGNMGWNATKLAASNSVWRTARAQIIDDRDRSEWLFIVSGVPMRMVREDGIDGTEAVVHPM